MILIIIHASKKMKINLMDQEKNRNLQHLMKMMYHLAASGTEIITGCAYDALFTILFNIWMSNPKKWKKIFKDSNEYVSTLHLWEWAIALHGRVLVPFCYW